jgi:predicted nucleotide-binding protein
MPLKFHGEPAEFEALISTAAVPGTWSHDQNGKYEFRTKDGAVLNWWPSRGTIQIQGQPAAKDRLYSTIEDLLSSTESLVQAARPVKNASEKYIFVVHGHDTEARDQLELILHRLGLQPFILMNSTGGGKTIIEALEGHIGRDFSSDFGIVLMTPDDIGYAKADGPDKAEPRARQNVVLETGMLLASLTRQRMSLLVKGHIELPSDLQGIIRYNFNDHVREIVPKLCARLREVGIDVDIRLQTVDYDAARLRLLHRARYLLGWPVMP